MRLVALVLLVVLMLVIAFGVVYVPLHDGRVTDWLLTVLLPSAGVCWCLAQLLPWPRKESPTEDPGRDRRA